jgi:hypothetical protein
MNQRQKVHQARKKLCFEHYESLEKKCEICGAEEGLVRDHSHATLCCRGWLCGPCNRGLGLLESRSDWLWTKHEIQVLENAVTYAKKWERLTKEGKFVYFVKDTPSRHTSVTESGSESQGGGVTE